jgi:NADH-quinone oxidoreductase subunit J
MSLIFYLLAVLTVAGGLAAVLLKNTVHCALALTVAFAGLALLFLNLDAQFAGFAQILVYIGAVAILVVFAILLTKGSETPQGGVFSRSWLVGIAAAAAVFAVLGWAVVASAPRLLGAAAPAASANSTTAANPAPAVTVEQIGRALAGRYVLPLEIVAVLLTVALIGAVIVAMHEKEEAK